MTSMDFIPPAPAEPAFVTTDSPCRKCRYNLRGFSLTSRCPECGTAVGFSITGDLIRYSDPDWTDLLGRGINCILWSVVATIFAGVLGAILGRGGPSLAPGLVGVVASILSLIGAWFLTTPDPSGLGEDQYGTSRKLIRVTLLVQIFSSALTFAMSLTLFPPAVTRTVLVVSGLAGLVGVVGTFATLNYLGKLALRIPDHKLSDRAKLLMWGVGIPLGLIILVSLMILLTASAGGLGTIGSGFAAFGCVVGLAGIALIVFGIMYLLFLEKLGKAFKAQARIARETWGAQPVVPLPPT